MKKIPLLAGLMLFFFSVSAQNNTTWVIKAGEAIAPIQPTMWGIFFEDINMGADGGLYAELVKNRSFEFTRPMMGWTAGGKKIQEGDMLVTNRNYENKANQRFLRVTVNKDSEGDLSLVNEGFRGMGIKKGLSYHFSLMYRLGVAGVNIHVYLTDSTGKKISEEAVLITKATGENWLKDSLSFKATETVLRGRLKIEFEGSGRIDLDMISLFPSDTWKNRPGGLRADMVQKLADLKPGFIRFPGGCIVEGFDLAQRYEWKKTVGPVDQRQLKINRWNNEFLNKPTPDYFQSFGLGFYEYFQMAEDIGAEPLPILSAGLACQFNSAEVVALNELDPYVQDALDLIEFANGDTSTHWGGLRAQMGHPASFHLKMMGVGNENWGPQYVERLTIFTKAIKSKYPDFKLVNSVGTDPDGPRFNYLDSQLRAMHADILDEHYYKKPDWFFDHARRYDTYPRNGSKIFCGEYAAQSDHVVSNNNRNNWLTALSEAAYMTGLERNAAVVNMASYAPLFAHIDAWQWTPDLIWVNNLKSYGTTDYYVQQLFSTNRGSAVVSILSGGDLVAGQDSLYATACVDSAAHELIIKMVNRSGKEKQISLAVEGAKKLSATAEQIILQNNMLSAENSFEEPTWVSPKESVFPIKNKHFDYRLAAYSFQILRIKIY